MSEPTSSSVTPKSSQLPTPNLPVCSVPYRWQLHTGHYVTVYMDHAQPRATWERHSHPTVQILVCGPGAECTIHWEADNAHRQLELLGEHVWIIGAGVPHWLEWHREAPAFVFYVKPEYGAETVGGDITGSSIFSLQQIAKCDAKIPHLLNDLECIGNPDTKTERVHLDSLASLVTLRLFRAWKSIRDESITHEATLNDVVLHRLNALIDERLDRKILLTDIAREVGMSRSNLCRLVEYYTALSKEELIRKLMLGKMQRSEYTTQRNQEIVAWVEENPDIKAKVEQRIRNVPPENRERAFITAAKSMAMNQTVQSRGVTP